jgi:hypothetical protein
MNIAKIIEKIKLVLLQLANLPSQIESLQQAIGRVEMRQLALVNSNDIHDNEAKVFSQWGEDGIIQFLINRVPIERKIFVEFGIGSYSECNTRFLLKNNNWSGLVIDGSSTYIQRLKRDPLFWQYNLQCECAFITKDNINEIITSKNITGDIGILSVDIDGNDYWIWQAIDCIQPRIVICEYNSLLGSKKNTTTIYDPQFDNKKIHFSGLYWGASIGAFNHLAQQKGYSLVGSNTAGNNIFFVRNDVLGDIPVYTPQEAHVKSQFRISRDKEGELSFLDAKAGLDIIQEMPLYEVDTGETIKVKNLRN